jgi:phosphoribosyl 1,2-cyclic phosphodiesterase
VRIWALGTGSNGNCLVLEANGERLVIEAGIGPIRAQARMKALGADLAAARAPLGVVVTHEHGDHAGHAHSLSRALRAPLFAHERVRFRRQGRAGELRHYVPGRPLALGPFVLESLLVPHDAPHVALRVSAGAARVAFAFDVGHATPALRAFLSACDLVFLESNHCRRLLDAGPYPLTLKRRVLGPLGHLANDEAADIAASLQDSRVARILLVHLSRVNNEPAQAHEVVSSRAPRIPVEVLPNGEGRAIDVEAGSTPVPARAFAQLAFAF